MGDSSGGDAVKQSSGSPPRQGWADTVGWDAAKSSKPGESGDSSTAWWNSTDTGGWGKPGPTTTKIKSNESEGDRPPKQDVTSTRANEAPVFHGTIWTDDNSSNQSPTWSSGPTGSNNRKSKLPPPLADTDPGTAPARKITGTNQVSLGAKIKWSAKVPPHEDIDMQDSTTPRCDPETSNVPPPPPPLNIQPPYSVVDGDTPLTPAAPGSALPLAPPRPKRKREGWDDKREMFKEYIKTWERAVRAKFHLSEAELNRDRWFRTRKSPCYARIGDAGINILESKRAEFDREYFGQREKLSLAVNALVDYQETVMSDFDLSQRYDIGEETDRFIAESTAYARQIRTLIEEFKDRDVPMRDPSPSTTTNLPSTEWGALQNRAEEMEESLEQIEAELTLSRPMDIRDIVDKVLDARLFELREARKQNVQKIAARVRPDIVIPPDSIEKMENCADQWREVEGKLSKTIEDISGLIVGNAQFKSRLEQLENENAEHREALTKLQDKYAATEELRRQKEKLQEDLDELMHQPPFGPCAPVESTCQHLIEELKPALSALIQKFYEQEIVPTVRTIGEAVMNGVSNGHQTELFRPQEHLHVSPQD
ncbi:hypothetical protein F5J12DRAFT_805261 [Pisolithus orientalis]|uniref:uncharacterized protein n=1 Tax=Pisolithus orientalis TaxID=936130 RepID=UPI0022251B1A|nr:uncharacterized protein F5J12DRAFT_805261 [Pisolithus orientalis]KAI6028412.1 hypothetical protein F5J12DRAFT_805261 [Pisolithus orientalis]